MGMMSFAMLMMLAVGGLAGNDALDYLASEHYWKTKNVVVSVEQLTGELKIEPAGDASALIDDLGSAEFQKRDEAARKLAAMGPPVIPQLEKAIANADDPEITNRCKQLIAQINSTGKESAVRRLMAIRTLGELKKAEALPVLRPLVDAKEPFVADYARQAIAKIEGKPYVRPGLTHEQRQADVNLLPADLCSVAQFSMDGLPPIGIVELLDNLELPPAFGKKEIFDQTTAPIIHVLDQLGNMRLDCATLGIADTVGPNAGYVVVIIRGEFDSSAGKRMLSQVGIQSKAIAGQDWFELEREFRLAMPSNQLLLIVGGPNEQMMPIDAMAQALVKGKGAFSEGEMAKLAANADHKAPIWGVLKPNAAMIQEAEMQAYDLIYLAATRKEGGIDYKLTATGSDPAALKQNVDKLSAERDNALVQMKEIQDQMPAIKPMMDLLENMKFQVQDKSATLTGRMDLKAMASMPWLMFGMRFAEPPHMAEPAIEPMIEPMPEPVHNH